MDGVGIQSDMLRRIGMVRRRVMQVHRLISPKADVINTILKRYVEADAETKYYLEDIHDHVLTMAQGLQSCDLSLTRSHSNYLAQVSINISKAQSDSNEIVLRMTLVASILVPLNIVTGLWGMNVRY